jgi:hypothetical protein
MVKWVALLIVVLMLTACVAALADEGKTPLALTYQIYSPTSSRTGDVFGSSWRGFGVDFLRPQHTEKWEKLVSFNSLSSDSIGDARLYAINYGIHKGIGTENKKAQPYVTLRVGPYHGDISVPALAIDESKWGYNANAAVGVLFNERFVLEARYDYYSSIGGFSFDGLTLSAGIKLFSL